MEIFLQALYFMLPAYFANMAPVLFAWIPWGSAPVDGGRTINGRSILGPHKTYRGLVSGILVAMVITFLQHDSSLSLIPYQAFSTLQRLVIGFAFGAGALGGDLIKSFFKRRWKIPSGRPWFPFDQLDFVIGALLAVSFIYTPPLRHLMVILVLTPLLHFLTNIAAYRLGLKKVWW